MVVINVSVIPLLLLSSVKVIICRSCAIVIPIETMWKAAVDMKQSIMNQISSKLYLQTAAMLEKMSKGMVKSTAESLAQKPGLLNVANVGVVAFPDTKLIRVPPSGTMDMSITMNSFHEGAMLTVVSANNILSIRVNCPSPGMFQNITTTTILRLSRADAFGIGVTKEQVEKYIECLFARMRLMIGADE